MKKDAKIYVAGHAGLVGSALIRELHRQGYSKIVTAPFEKLDLRRQSDVEAFFSSQKPDVVFLAAARVGGIGANNTYKADFIYDNLMIACNVIHAAHKFGVQKLLNLGSSCIYPKHAPQPLKEEYLLTDVLESTNEPYAIAKISAIKLCRYFNEQYKTNFISVMPTNLYGPGDNYNLETSHVIPALIRKFHLGKLLAQGNEEALLADVKNYPLGYGMNSEHSLDKIKNFLMSIGITKHYVTLWGTGSPFREFLFMDDLARACVFLMQDFSYDKIGEFVNVGTGKEIHIADLADMIKKIISFKGEVRWDSEKPDGTPRKLLDVSKVKKLGWHAQVDLNDGLQKAYDAYGENNKNTEEA